MSRLLTADEVLAAELGEWRQLLQGLSVRYRTRGLAEAIAFAGRVGELADAADHHPDIDLRYRHVQLRLFSHDVGGITDRDIALARQISAAAADAGLVADVASLQVLELALDTPDAARIRPFWAAVLGADPARGADDDEAIDRAHRADDEVIDPARHLPALWFQQTDAHDAPRQRFHLDVTVPHDQAEARLAAAIAAGGTLVSDERAPAFWVLADADGNHACICTQLARD